MSITFYRGSAFAGKTRETPSGVVTYIGSPGADIVYMPFTHDRRDVANKKFRVSRTRRRYATLDAAAAAVVTAREAMTTEGQP